MILSSVLEALPRLTEVRLSFRMTVKDQDWLESYAYFSQMTVRDIRAVSNAIRSTGNSGVSSHTINLLRFKLPHYEPWQDRDLSTL
jgi:hypothetical protein